MHITYEVISIDVQTTRSLNCLNDTSRFGFEPRRLSLVYIFSKNTTSATMPDGFKILYVCAAFISRHHQNGGASQDRTDDPLLAKQVLSQLSYGPK
jgi:hypothetical protein